nr:MAG TPA: hypothetical protein [Caudoviricetes sp.]
MDNALCRIPLYTKNRSSNPRLPISPIEGMMQCKGT